MGHSDWGSPLYLGQGSSGSVFAPSESSLLVLGPPRSGKSSAVVSPNVVMAAGPVLSTSTKPDVMQATWKRRSEVGRCWLFDPSFSYELPSGVSRLAWSPMISAISWEGALSTARALVQSSNSGRGVSEPSHWQERAEALLAPLLHAASLSNSTIEALMSWIHRQDVSQAQGILVTEGASIAADVLAGITATEARERSSIFSTAAGSVAAYRSTTARQSAAGELLDPAGFVNSADTIYVCAPARQQGLAAPLVVGLCEDLRAAAYSRAHFATGEPKAPLLFALDEAANIAPLPDLPAIASEGASQGLVTLACFQDLSQARARWGELAKGFLSLFGAKLVLPGIGDLATLETLSVLAGEEDVFHRSHTVSRSGLRISRSTSSQGRLRRRLPPDLLSKGRAGSALWFQGGAAPASVKLTSLTDIEKSNIDTKNKSRIRKKSAPLRQSEDPRLYGPEIQL